MSKELLTTDQVKNIREIVEKHLKVDLSERLRDRHTADARKIYSMLCRKHTIATMEVIANEIDRHYSSVVAHLRTGNGLLSTAVDFSINYNRLDAKIPKFNSGLSKVPTEVLKQRQKAIRAELRKTEKELSERMK